MRARKKGKSIFKIIIVILLSAALLGSVAYAIRNFDEIIENVGNMFDDNNLSVVYQDNKITGSAQNLRFNPDEPNALNLNNAGEYSISIRPAPGADFDFIVNNNYYSFAAIDDLTSCFDITQEESAILVNSTFTMDEILQNKYPGEDIEIIDDLADIDYFILTIESAGDIITLEFGCNFSVMGVSLIDSLVVHL